MLFRQPTLAVGRNGLETVFDCGYTYAVAGYYSTGDYKAESVDELVTALRQNVRSGSILVMHFSDNAQYTPEAVDQFLSKMEYYKTGYRFVGLNKVL